MEQVKVLGISGSPREAATEYAVKQALRAAAEVPGVETRLLTLRGRNIAPCRHCDSCLANKQLCCIEDDMRDLYEYILWADAYIAGSPVYTMTISGPLQTFFNRWRPLHHVYRGILHDRVAGAIAVAAARNGGQETTVSTLLHYFLARGMIVVGGGIPSAYSGAYVVSQNLGAEGAKADLAGMESVANLGRRVAQVASWVKTGKAADEVPK